MTKGYHSSLPHSDDLLIVFYKYDLPRLLQRSSSTLCISLLPPQPLLSPPSFLASLAILPAALILPPAPLAFSPSNLAFSLTLKYFSPPSRTLKNVSHNSSAVPYRAVFLEPRIPIPRVRTPMMHTCSDISRFDHRRRLNTQQIF
jgi:hypothetical protein